MADLFGPGMGAGPNCAGYDGGHAAGFCFLSHFAQSPALTRNLVKTQTDKTRLDQRVVDFNVGSAHIEITHQKLNSWRTEAANTETRLGILSRLAGKF